MSSARSRAQEEFIGGTSQYLNNLSDYRHDYKGILRSSTALPFFIEMIDRSNRPVTIPWPPRTNNADSEVRVLGIKLIINPASLSVNMAKIVNRTQSMVGWIEEHWGDEIDTVTLSGSTAAFVTGRTLLSSANVRNSNNRQDKAQARADFYQSLGFTDDPIVSQENRGYLRLDPGLTTRYRRDSISYGQMKDLVRIFASNGCVFDPQGFVRDRRFIRISYDYSSYVGYFESIDVTEDATAPFRFTYTITFKAERTSYKFLTRNSINSFAGDSQ